MNVNCKISEKIKIVQKIQTADATGGVDAGWVDARGFRKFAVCTCASALTGTGVTALVLQGNTASDGSGTDTTLATYAGGGTPDAVGDSLWLECDLDDAVPTSSCRYVNAVVTCNNAADDTVVTYILTDPIYPTSGLSADVIA